MLKTESAVKPKHQTKPTEERERERERERETAVDWEPFFNNVSGVATTMEYGAGRKVFAQGQPADSMFYIKKGKVKLSVVSKQGKEAIIVILEDGDFFGEGCIAGQLIRMSSAVTVGETSLIKVSKPMMVRLLDDKPDFAKAFTAHLLTRNIRFEEDLVDQLFNNSEKRLARVLLLLAHYGKDTRTETLIHKINQEELAQMIGTTRSRVSYFMNKFKSLGFIDYKRNGETTVNSGLLSVVLHD